MPAPLRQIETESALPARADVVVIGAGIVGTCTAYYLAKRGIGVALVEKGVVGGEQSSRNWGWCRQQNRDARELPVATRSLDLWDRLAADIGEETGFRRCGLTYLSDEDEQLDLWTRWRDMARSHGVTTHMLDSAEATARGAATGRRWKGGVFSASDGTADPSRAVPAIALGVRKLGGTVHQACAARGLETAGGRVSGVVTEHGTIRTSQVVMAGGAWASAFCHQLGVSFPQTALRSSILAVAPGAEGLPAALHTSEISVTRRGDGGYTLAISGRAQVDPTIQQILYARHFVPMLAKRWRALTPGTGQAWFAGHETRRRWALDRVTPMERNRILDPRPSRRILDQTLARARTMLPAFERVSVQAEWAGYIDNTPDGIPVIGPVAAVPGLLLAAGFSGHGFGIGPGAGHLAADLVSGAPPITDPVPYRLDRFSRLAWGKVSEF